MDIKRKIELAQQSIASIARHDDEDLAVREAALNRVGEIIAAERDQMEERVKARIAQTVGASTKTAKD